MTKPGPVLLFLLVTMTWLGGCGHSRVVKREYSDSQPASSQHSPAVRARTTPLPAPSSYIVKSGDTLYGIAFRFGLKFKDVAAWNQIVEPYNIQVNQRLHLRPLSGASATRISTTSASSTTTVAPTASSNPSPPSLASAGTAVAVGSSPDIPASKAAVDNSESPAVPGGPGWRWPTTGQIVGSYVAGDQTQQGINIAGNSGQPVNAAADGLVVYSGAGLVGYGELIIIKHSDEWLSAYAHNRRRLVAEGAHVKAGDAIAEMGRSGAIRDMLHFEIRRNGKPVDPLIYLPKP